MAWPPDETIGIDLKYQIHGEIQHKRIPAAIRFRISRSSQQYPEKIVLIVQDGNLRKNLLR
jgi:hypothetical protein